MKGKRDVSRELGKKEGEEEERGWAGVCQGKKGEERKRVCVRGVRERRRREREESGMCQEGKGGGSRQEKRLECVGRSLGRRRKEG